MNKTFIPFPVLKTERLTLRQLSVNDDQAILALRSDQQVNKYINRATCNTIEDARKFIDKIAELVSESKGIYWAVTLTDTDQLAGTCCLFNFSTENNQAEIGYELLPAFQQQGIMQEAIAAVIAFAFDVIGLKAIEAHTHPENKSSAKLLAKHNFRQQKKPDTKSKDTIVVFKLLRA
jgi:ribosomal-protein-alanine N-acetyltransferase